MKQITEEIYIAANLCVCVCMYLCVCVCMYVCVYVCMYALHNTRAQ